MLERLRQKSWEFSKELHVGCSLAVSRVLRTLQLYKVSLAGSPHEHLLILHSHTQPISFCPVCAQHGDTRSTPLFYHFCAGTGKAQADLLKGGLLGPVAIWETGSKASKAFGLERQKSIVKQCPWGLSGNRNGKEVCRGYKEFRHLS